MCIIYRIHIEKTSKNKDLGFVFLTVLNRFQFNFSSSITENVVFNDLAEGHN